MTAIGVYQQAPSPRFPERLLANTVFNILTAGWTNV